MDKISKINTINKKQQVLILGANSDIAKSLAYKFSKLGYHLQLALRDYNNLKKIQKDLELRFNNNIELLEYDATDLENISFFCNKTIKKPDIVIMCVGLFYTQDEIEIDNITDVQKAKELMLTNFFGPALILENLAENLSKNNNNPVTIVTISSVAGDRGRAKNYWYGSAKSALNTFLSGLRQKYNNSNLTIITVKPGFVNTKMLKNQKTPKWLTQSPDEAADMIISSIKNKKLIVYSWKWYFIMGILKILPEKIFKKLKF